jgi:hypothetical protein
LRFHPPVTLNLCIGVYTFFVSPLADYDIFSDLTNDVCCGRKRLSAESPILQTRPWRPDRPLLATVSGRCITLLCITRGKSYREPYLQSWTRNSGNQRWMCTFSSTDWRRCQTRSNTPLWVLGTSSTPHLGKRQRLQIWNIELGVGQEDGRRRTVFEHLAARHNAGSWSVQDDFPDWAVLHLDRSGNVLPCCRSGCLSPL